MRRVIWPTTWLRLRIAANVRAALGGEEEDLADYHEPLGDQGLFGPSSPAWIVHADLPSMLYGGFAALMLQTLSPRTMAGVAQHSNYRVDPTGRLKRTARFVAGTTFGPMPFVEQLFGEVLAVHARVQGTTDDGMPYSALDPELLTWVHITEVSNFLYAFERYGPRTLSDDQKDRYFAETAVIAERLGATDVPRSRSEVTAYFQQVRPTLMLTTEAIAAVHFLRSNSVTIYRSTTVRIANNVVRRVVTGAAIDLLPDYAKELLGLDLEARVNRLPRRLQAHLLAYTFRWALGPSLVAMAAARRIGEEPGSA